MLHRYFIQLSYQGTQYHGWQIQPDLPTIQNILNKALSTILRENIEVTGAGRTDTGVHAKCFYAHFNSLSKLLKKENNLVFQLNGILPSDIAVQKIVQVKTEAHARFNAISRTYEYHISQGKDPFSRDFEYYFSGKLNFETMNQAARILFDYDDFTSFSKLHTQTESNICKVTEAVWKKKGDKLIFTIKADRFLRNMVRAIVGTLLQVGTGKIKPEDIRNIINSKKRSAAGPSAPAHGLILTNIEYPENIFMVNQENE